MPDLKYESLMGLGPKRITHNEFFSCPDAETELTGIDYYDHPKACRERWNELFPHMPLWVPKTDEPKKRPELDGENKSADLASHAVRWGDCMTGTFKHGEAFWGILKDAGKEVIMIVDGCVDAYVDDIMACGARGIVSEPYTDFKSIARRYPTAYLAGEGDNRVLSRNNPGEIRAMVESMVETGKMCSGYEMSIGNHIPWNIPAKAVKLYLDLSAELGYR